MAITGTTTISQLTALNSASLDTTLVGVDNGATYKIELDVVADAVSDRINTLDGQRLNNLEQFTSSVSNVNISSLNNFTSSYNTGSFSGSLNGISTFSNEIFINSASLDKRYSLVLSDSSTNEYNVLYNNNTSSLSFNPITNLFRAQHIFSQEITASIGATNGVISSSVQISNLGFITSSTTVLPTGVISGSSQITTLGFISSSIPLTSLNSYTSSATIRLNNLESATSSINSLNTTQTSRLDQLSTFTASNGNTSLNSYTSSATIRLNNLETTSASLLVETSNLETFSASALLRLTNIESATSSINSLNTTQNSRLDQLSTFSASNANTSLNSYTASNDTKWNALGVLTGSYATTGSNTFKGNQIVSASVYVTGDLIVFGTSSFQNVTASVVELGTNTIVLNTDTPAVRFGGISVIDSGSNAGTGSLWWDSNRNHWLYEHPSDSLAPYNSAMLIAGPTNTGSLGEEIGLTTGKLTVAVGEDHISSSQITDDGRTVTIPGILSASVISGFGNVLSFSTSVDSRLDLVELTASILNTTFSSSIDNRLDLVELTSSILNTTFSTSVDSRLDLVELTSSILNTTFSASVDSRLDLVELTSSILNTTFSTSVDSRLDNIEIATSSYETKGRGIVSGSSQLTSSFDNRYILETETGSFLTSLNGAISSSSQLTSSYDLRYTLSGSVQPLPSGVISGSSQLTASLDVRYALSGSVGGGGGSVPAGTISGSSQLTSSFDLRYLVTGSVTSSILQLNTFTASNGNTSLNSYTASNNTKWNTIGALTSSFATTGSNEFNGNQTITGSLTVSSVAVVSSSLSANSSSLTLSSGSNLYIYNNGFIEVTGSIIVSGGGITGSIRATNGVISGSSQLTASFDTRYALSGSVGGGSTDITSLNLYTSSNDIINTTQNSRLDQLSTFSGSNGNTSLNSYTSSNDTTNNNQNSRLNNLETFSGSNGTTSLNSYTSSATIRLNNLETTSASLNTSVLNLNSFTQSTSQRLLSIESVSGSWITESETSSFERTGQGIVSGSSQLTSSYDLRYTLSGSVQPLPSNLISSSAQISSFGFISESVNISSLNLFTQSTEQRLGSLEGESSSYLTSLNGAISSSSQLTSSYDVRYILSGSVIPSTSANTFDFNEEVSAGKIGFLEDSGSNYRISPQSDRIDISYQGNVFAKIDVIDGYSGSVLLKNGIISGSSQLTSSFDSRYLITGSVTSSILQLNTFTSSLNIWSSSVATTGSNTFRGTETISGSLLVSGSTTFTGSISISSGSITMPNRPAFRIIGTGGPTAAQTILSGSRISVDFNQGNYFNTTTGLFTAPIAGLYQVNLVVRTFSNTNSTINQVIVYKSGSAGDETQIMVEFGTNTTMNHAGGSTISKLAVGDTLRAVVAVGTCSFDQNDNFSVAYIG